MLKLDYPTFREIIGKVSFDKRSPIYFYEDTKRFVLFFTDGQWKYATTVPKDEIRSFVPHSELDKDYINFIKEFRKRNLDGAIRVVGFDYDIDKQDKPAVEELTPEKTDLVNEIPKTDDLPFQTKEPEPLVAEVNRKLAEGGGL